MNLTKILLLLAFCLVPAPVRADGPEEDTRPVSPTRPAWTGDSDLHLLGHRFGNVQAMADHWGALNPKDELPGALDSATRDVAVDLVVFQDLDDRKLYVSYSRDGIFSHMGWATAGRIGTYQGRRVKVLWSRDEPNTFLEGAYQVLPWIGSVFGESGASQFRGAVATAMGAVLSSGITAFVVKRAAENAGGLTRMAGKSGFLAGLWSSLRVPVLAGIVAVAGTVVIGGIASGVTAMYRTRTHAAQRELIVSQLIAPDGVATQQPPPAAPRPPSLREGIERVLPDNVGVASPPRQRVTTVTPGDLLGGDDVRFTSRDG